MVRTGIEENLVCSSCNTGDRLYKTGDYHWECRNCGEELLTEELLKLVPYKEYSKLKQKNKGGI